MVRHIDFLGILYLVWGGLTGLLGAAMFALAAGAAVVFAGAAPGDEGARTAAGLTAATFATIGLLALGWGGANALTGRALRRRKPGSHAGTLTLGVLNLLLLPFGTALGVYTLWVLLHDEVREALTVQPEAHPHT